MKKRRLRCLIKEEVCAALLLPKLYGQPVVNVALVRKWTHFTRAGAQTVINRFIEMGILSPKNKNMKYGQ